MKEGDKQRLVLYCYYGCLIDWCKEIWKKRVRWGNHITSRNICKNFMHVDCRGEIKLFMSQLLHTSLTVTDIHIYVYPYLSVWKSSVMSFLAARSHSHCIGKWDQDMTMWLPFEVVINASKVQKYKLCLSLQPPCTQIHYLLRVRIFSVT